MYFTSASQDSLTDDDRRGPGAEGPLASYGSRPSVCPMTASIESLHCILF